MNRIIQVVFIISLISSPALGQEADTARNQQDTSPEQDTSFLPIQAPVLETSTDRVVQPEDSVYRISDRDLRFADTLQVFEPVAEPDFDHSASRAIMFSLVLPGLGQAYNKKYFKMPVVYAALGFVGYTIVNNTKNYQQASLNYALTPDATNERYLRGWRRYVELSYIGLIVVYALQVVDAYVDAQLHSWDVNQNLSLRMTPSIQPLMVPDSKLGQAYGLTCSFDLKRR